MDAEKNKDYVFFNKELFWENLLWRHFNYLFTFLLTEAQPDIKAMDLMFSNACTRLQHYALLSVRNLCAEVFDWLMIGLFWSVFVWGTSH